jgi:hypothetical protein
MGGAYVEEYYSRVSWESCELATNDRRFYIFLHEINSDLRLSLVCIFCKLNSKEFQKKNGKETTNWQMK